MKAMNLKYNIQQLQQRITFYSFRSYLHFESLCKSYGVRVIAQLRRFFSYYIKHELLIEKALCCAGPDWRF